MAAVLCSAVSACSAAVASPRRGTRGGGGRGVASSMHHLKLLHRLSNFSSRFAFVPCMNPGWVTFRTRGNKRIFFTSGNTSVVVDSGSKRRARGPLMAAKKAAEGECEDAYYSCFCHEGKDSNVCFSVRFSLSIVCFFCSWSCRKRSRRRAIQRYGGFATD